MNITLKLRSFMMFGFLLVFPAAFCAAACVEGPSGVFVCDNAADYEEDIQMTGVSLTKTGGGAMLLTGANDISDDVLIEGGSVAITSAGNLGGAYDMGITSAALQTDNNITLDNDINLSNGTFNVNSGSLTLTGGITGSGLVKEGAGTLFLEGANTVDNVSIYGGVLSIIQPVNLTGALTLGAAGAFEARQGMVMNNNFSVQGGTINVVGVGPEEEEEGENYLLLTGALTGSSFTKTGLGILGLGTSNKYTGAISVLEGGVTADIDTFDGNIYLAPPAQEGEEGAFLVYEAETDGTFNGNISGGGNLMKAGNGILTLTGSNTAADNYILEGALSISSSASLQGDVHFDYGTELIVTADVTLGGAHKQTLYLADDQLGAKNLNVSAGATLTLGGFAEIAGEGDLVKDGAGKLFLNYNYAQGTYGGDLQLKSGVLEIIDGNVLGGPASHLLINNGELLVSQSASINRDIRVQTASSAINVADGEELELLYDLQGYGTLNKKGLGTLNALEGGLLHSGGTKITEGTVIASGFTIQGNVDVSSGAHMRFQQDEDGVFVGALSGAGTVYKEGAGVLALTGVYTGFNGLYDIREGAIQGSSGNLTADIITAADTSVIFNQLFDGAYNKIISGAGSLFKAGAGVLELNSANTYTGGTMIVDSYGLLIHDDNNLGDLAGEITLFGGNLATADGSDIETDRNFELLSGNGANNITVGAGATYTINGVISGGSFQKKGAGTLLLTGVNTHENGTQISAGTLRVLSQDALGEGMLSITGGALNTGADMELDINIYLSGLAGFDVDAGTALTTTGILFGGGTVNKKGLGALTLEGYNNYLGGLDIEAGLVNGTDETILGNIKISAGAQLNFMQDYDGWYTGDINGAAGSIINKYGEGLLVMEGGAMESLSFGAFNVAEGSAAVLSNFSGDINIAQDALLLVSANGGGVINAAGNLFIDGAQNRAYAGDIYIQDGGVLTLDVKEGRSNLFEIKQIVPPAPPAPEPEEGAEPPPPPPPPPPYAGNITFESGGKLEIFATGVFANPYTTDILAYEGVLDGDISGVNVSNNRRLKAYIDDSRPGMLSLTIERMLTQHAKLAGLKYNQLQAAKAIDKASAAPSADFELILDAIDDFVLSRGGALAVGATQVLQASLLNQLGGFIYANIPLINSFNMLTQNAYLRINSGDSGGGNNIWVQTAANYAKIRESAEAENLYNFSSGAVFGFDKYYEGGTRAGFVASYARHDLKHNSLENLDGDEYHAGAYLLLRRGGFDLAGALTLGFRDSVVNRNIAFLGRSARARLRSFSVNADAEGSYNITDVLGCELRPFAALTASGERRQSFAETGAGSANLSGGGETALLLAARGGLGLKKNRETYGYYTDLSLKQNIVNPQTGLTLAGQDYKIKPYDASVMYGLRAGGYIGLSRLITLYGDAGGDFNDKTNNLFFNIGIRSYW